MKQRQTAQSDTDVLQLPCGTRLDLRKPRSAGVLSPHELDACRVHNVALAYDPVQIGWVPAACTDDISPPQPNARSARNGTLRSAIATQPQVNTLHPQYQLRSWDARDLETYLSLLDDPRVWRYMPEAYPDPLTPQTAAALIELSNASNHHQVYAVQRNAEIVGQVRLEYDVDPSDSGTAEISYWIGKGHWGKGIGSDIVALFTARCFADVPGLTRIIARVHPDNEGSATVLRKCGYQKSHQRTSGDGWVIWSITRDAQT